MSLRRGDFALVYLPHSDLRTVKLRPVLVIQAEELNTGLPQVIVVMVSSNLERAGHPSRVAVRLKDALAVQTGLKSDSVIMTDNLATIELQLVKRAIGRMPRMEIVDQALRKTLGLWPVKSTPTTRETSPLLRRPRRLHSLNRD